MSEDVGLNNQNLEEVQKELEVEDEDVEEVDARTLLASKPLLQNLTLKAENTEYKIPFSPETRKFLMQARTSVELRLAFEKGAVADTTLGKDYFTLKSGDAYWEDHLDLDGTIIIYVACGTAGTIVEIIKWMK